MNPNDIGYGAANPFMNITTDHFSDKYAMFIAASQQEIMQRYANAFAPPKPKRCEPSEYLMPKPGQQLLNCWVPSYRTDIRALFRRVRQQQESKT